MTLRDDSVLSYVECDLPPGVTIAEYRRGRAPDARIQRRRRIRALLRALRCGQAPRLRRRAQ
jgi:hypothetical protein